jgi:hypothetical protein
MRNTIALFALLFLGAFSQQPAWTAPKAAAPPLQEIVDRIVARIEDDIITLSEVRELAAYQQLIDGRTEPEDRLRSELIEQWVINNEASAARFPPPAASEVDREVGRIEARFSSQQAYRERLDALGLTPGAINRMVTREIYLARYLDYKFRPSVQVSDDDIAKYYRNELVPPLAAKKQAIPTLASVSDQIREVLVQRGIDDRAASWLDQTKSRLKIEIESASATTGAPGPSNPPAAGQQ